MQKVTTKAMAKVAAVATGLAMATSMLSLAPMAHAAALTSSQVQSILSLLSSFGADSSTIANVQASLTGGTPSSTTTTTTTTTTCTFTKDLTLKSTGTEVTGLQQALIANGYMTGSATGYFGPITQAAVIKWQKASGVTPAAGYFGAKSRAAFKLSCSGSTTTTGTTTTGAGTGTGLKVSLSPTSPNGTVLIAGQGIGDLGDFVFANPTSAPINVTALSFNRIGVSNDSTLSNVYLYNNGTRITDSAGVNNSAFTYSDPTALFTVPAGGTYTVSVRSDIATLTSGQQIGVSLVSATSNGTLDSSVSFPIASGYQTISSADIAKVNFVNTVATPAVATISAQNDYPVWQDNISVSTNPVKLASMKFTNLGSADSSSIVNLRLYVDGVQVGSAVPTMGASRSVTFDFSSAPALLSTSSHVVKVLANITNAAAGRTVQFSVQRGSDGMFIDSQLNQPVSPTSGNGATSFSTVSTGAIGIQSASAGVSVSLDPASPNQNVAAGASNVKWASFDMLASGENVKVSDLYVYAVTSVANDGLNNGKIMVNGVQVGSTHDIVYGANNSVPYGSATDFSLGSSLILPAGQTTVVDVYADAQTTTGVNLANNETVTVYLAGSSSLSNGQGVSSYVSTSVPSSSVPSNAVTISTSSLSASKSTSYGDQTVVAGSNNAKLGSFALSTGSTGSVSVNTINITFANAVSSTITNLTLKDSATGSVLGSVITTPSTDNSFSVSLTIPASSSKTIDIYANILSGANNGTIQATVGTGTTGTDSSGQSASVASPGVALQSIGLGQGSLTVSNGAGDPVSNNILAGASSVNVGEFNFAAQNSSYTVQNLAILVPDAQANNVSNVTLSYKDVNGAAQTVSRALVSTGSTYATATFQGLTMYVPANDSANLDVSIGTPTIAANATSGAGIKVSLDTGITASTFRAVNSAGVAKIQVNNGVNVAAGGTFYVRKSIPTFAMVPTGSTVPSTGQPLYKFSITADPAGAIEWTHLVFNIATSSTNALSVTNLYLTDDSSGTSLIDGYATSTATMATFDLGSNVNTPKYQQVAAGATKTYDLYGTVAGFSSPATVTISLASDGTVLSGTHNEVAAPWAAGNVVWSDRSGVNGVHNTGTADWTNGFLLKNFTSNAISYTI